MLRYPLLLVLFSWMFSGCAPEDVKRIGVSQCSIDPWRNTMRREMERELLFHDNVELLYREVRDNNELQIRDIRELVEHGIDLLIVSPNEAAALRPVIQEVYQQGIPVILLDRTIDGDAYTSYIGADNRLIGAEAARYITRLLSNEGLILELVENQSITAFHNRSIGFNQELSVIESIKIDTARVVEPGRERFMKLLSEKQYDAVFAPTDRAALYAYKLARELGLHEQIHFIGVDALPDEGIELVSEGILTASLLYPTGGDVAIRVAMDILNDNPYKIYYPLSTLVIDSTNVAAIQLQNDRLLGQQQDVEELAERMDSMLGVFKNQRVLLYFFGALLILSISFLIGLVLTLKSRKRINRQLISKNEEITKYAKEAEDANQQKFQFFTNISHEFRTPLTLILSPLDELISKKETYPFKHELQMIKKNTLRLLRLVSQVMDFRKLDGGVMKLKAQQVNIVPFINEIVQAFEKATQLKKVNLLFHAEQEEIFLWIDQGLFDKVLFNLLSNALKFTPEGGTIRLKVEQVHLEDYVKVVIEDTGSGMSEEDLRHIFDRFYQGEQNRSVGTGIGLSLTKEIMELHHGTIQVESKIGKGTRFEIGLKMGDAHLKPHERLEEVQEYVISEPIIDEIYELDTYKTSSIKEHTILLIEDNNELRKYLTAQLQNFYNVIEASNVEGGILLAFDEVPDLIVCDLMLENESGFDVIKGLKSDLRTSHIPIIILTAKTATEDRVQGIRLGADDYITKPFSFTLLAERINTLMVNREKLREHYSLELPIDSRIDSPSKQNRKFINDFTALIEQNISKAGFGVSDIVAHLGLSRVQLYRKVKAILGYSVNDYINNVRLKKAKSLIVSGDYTISEVAHKVGYSSPAYFSTAFKNHFGITPTEFQGQSHGTHLKK